MLGNRVTVVVDEKKHHGTVKYVGAFDGAPNSGAWCGIRLDAPGIIPFLFYLFIL